MKPHWQLGPFFYNVFFNEYDTCVMGWFLVLIFSCFIISVDIIIMICLMGENSDCPRLGSGSQKLCTKYD